MSMIRKTLWLLALTGKTYRFTKRFVSGQPLDGQRRTDATFFRPATRSLDPSGTALRWEMMRGASRAAIRVGLLYLLLLLLLLPLLRLLSSLWGDAPWWLTPSGVLLLHLTVISVSISVSVTWQGSVEYGVRLPVLRRVETEEEIEAISAEAHGEEKREVRLLAGSRWELGWWETLGRKSWEMERVLPLAEGLSTMLNLGHMTREKARRVVHVPRDFREPGRKIEILLPKTFTGADAGLEKRIKTTVQRRLGFKEEMTARWELEGSSPRVLLEMPPAPPNFISYTEMLPYLRAAEEFSPVVGVVAGGEALSISLKNDSPHIAVSAGSGAGKSVLIKTLAIQFRHWGWNIVVLDWKEESQEWAKGGDGVRYCTSIAAIHDMCIMLGEEVEARKSNPHIPRPKTLIIAEEMNITAALLTDYWTALRAQAEPEERRLMPMRSPAVSGLMKVNFTGRQLMMCQIFVAQRFSARVTNGNADLRESFQVLFMARWKSQTLKMLAAGIKPFPKMPKEVGRWVAVVGEQTAVVQVPLIEDHEAREFAFSGEVAAASPFIAIHAAPGPTTLNADDVDLTLEDSLGDRPALHHQAPSTEQPLKRLRKLADLVDGIEYLGVTHNVLKHAAKDHSAGGDPQFPPAEGGSPNRGYLYDEALVLEWARRRFAAREAERKNRA